MTTVTKNPGHYRRPRFSPDGRTIVFEKGEGGDLTSETWSASPGVYRISAAGGEEAVPLTHEGGNPHFGTWNDRILMELPGDDQHTLVSTGWNAPAQRNTK